MSFINNLKSNLVDRFLSKVSDRDVIAEAAMRKQNSIDGSVIPHPKSLVSADINTWRSAVTAALHSEDPQRLQLYRLYDNVMVDNHLSSIIESRILRVMGSPFRVVDENGEENTDLTKLLQKPWFEQFVKHAVASLFYGSTCVELVLGEDTIDRAALIPRENCNFKKKVIYLTPEDEKGISFINPPQSNTIIEIGNFYDLGLLYKAAPIAMAKKYAIGSWTEYTEKFGIPFRWVTTDITNNARATKLGEIMDKMGSAGWGVFKKGEEIQVMNTPGTSAHEIFDALIDRMNKELSKLVLGQTMTTDDGASRSQAQVHEAVAEDRHLHDKILAKNIVNMHLLPRLTLLGIGGFQGYTFEWDLSESLSLNEFIDAVTKLSANYELDTDQITEKTGITIIGTKMNDTATKEAQKKKPLNKALIAQIEAYYSHYRSHGDPIAIDLTGWQKLMEQIAKDTYTGKIKPGELSEAHILETYKELFSAAKKGYGNDWTKVNKATGMPDASALELQKNIFRFSQAKNYSMLQKLNGGLVKDGKVVPWNSFKEHALKLNKEYNINYLNAEYLTARQSSNMAVNWKEYQNNKEKYPNLKYTTQGDNRVREQHDALNDIIKPVDDPFWDTYYPPNGWRCRCYVEQTTDEANDREIEPNTVIPQFHGNVGKSGQIFPENASNTGEIHPYFNLAKSEGQKLQKAMELQKLQAPLNEYYKAKKGATVKISPFTDTRFTELLGNYRDAKTLADLANVSVDVVAHLDGRIIKNQPNAEYKINGNPADRKTPKGQNYKNILKKAAKQECNSVVINLRENGDSIENVVVKLDRIFKFNVHPTIQTIYIIPWPANKIKVYKRKKATE